MSVINIAESTVVVEACCIVALRRNTCSQHTHRTRRQKLHLTQITIAFGGRR